MTEGTSSRPAELTMQRTWAACVLAALFPGNNAAVLLVVLYFAHLGPRWLFWPLCLLALGVLAAFVAWNLRIWRRGVVTVTGDAVCVAGIPIVRRRAIQDAFRHRARTGVVVRIKRKLATECDITFANPEDADAFLEALGKAPRRATASFAAERGGRYSRRLHRLGSVIIPAAVVATLVGIMGWAGGTTFHFADIPKIYVMFLGVSLACLAATTLARRSTIVVGLDGIRVHGLRRSMFYSYAELREVRRDRTDVVMAFTSGRAVRFGVVGGGYFREEAEGAVQALIERIEDARAATAPGASPHPLAGALARQGRATGDWIHALHDILLTPGTFRTAPVSADRLWRILEDPTQSAAARAGAAVALRPRLDDHARTRLRIAEETCASAELRAALQAVSRDDDEETIEQALALIEAQGG